MNPHLEALLKAWDTYLETKPGHEADRWFAEYWEKVEGVSQKSKVRAEVLHRAVQAKYVAWRRANANKFPTVPPKA